MNQQTFMPLAGAIMNSSSDAVVASNARLDLNAKIAKKIEL
jgi:hypothetical protein